MLKRNVENASRMNCAKCYKKRSGVELTNIEGKVADGEYMPNISVVNADNMEKEFYLEVCSQHTRDKSAE
ncbi:11352_t:CDS:2, partial [Dentiscutata erythropus]